MPAQGPVRASSNQTSGPFGSFRRLSAPASFGSAPIGDWSGAYSTYVRNRSADVISIFGAESSGRSVRSPRSRAIPRRTTASRSDVQSKPPGKPSPASTTHMNGHAHPGGRQRLIVVQLPSLHRPRSSQAPTSRSRVVRRAQSGHHGFSRSTTFVRIAHTRRLPQRLFGPQSASCEQTRGAQYRPSCLDPRTDSQRSQTGAGITTSACTRIERNATVNAPIESIQRRVMRRLSAGSSERSTRNPRGQLVGRFDQRERGRGGPKLPTEPTDDSCSLSCCARNGL